MVKKIINVYAWDNGKDTIEVATKSFLSDIRKEWLDIITFPFIFSDEYENEIPKGKEDSLILEDVLSNKKLFLKQVISWIICKVYN